LNKKIKIIYIIDIKEELNDKFPNKNQRNGIIIILGTFIDN